MANNQQQQVLHPVIADELSETHDFTFTEDGMLTIRDIESLMNGNDDNPAEFARLNLHSARVLFKFLDRPDVQAVLRKW